MRRAAWWHPGVSDVRSLASSIPMLWRVLLGYMVVQIVIVLFFANGPFVDEAICAAAGLRVLRGFGLSDGYFYWFSGSPLLWPVFAGLGYKAAGLVGARLMAVILSTVSLLAIAEAARELFGESVGCWTAIALILNGYFLTLGHFAVYDQPGLTGMSLALWFIVRHEVTGKRSYVWLAALAICVATIGKYAFVAMLPPLVIVLLVSQTRSHARSIWIDGLILVGVSTLGIIGYLLLFRARLGNPGHEFFRQAGVYGRSQILYNVLYPIAVPAMLGVVGAAILWRSGRGALGLALLWPLAIWPAFHVITANHVSLWKHVVIGALFTAPLAGLSLESLWRKRSAGLAPVALCLLAVLGGMQWYRVERAWEPMQPAVEYVRARFEPGDHLIVAINSWAFGLDFYVAQMVDNPGFPTNQYELGRTGAATVCENKWLVDDGYVQGVTDLLNEAIAKCPFRVAFRYPADTYAITNTGRWATIPHDVVVYQRSEALAPAAP